MDRGIKALTRQTKETFYVIKVEDKNITVFSIIGKICSQNIWEKDHLFSQLWCIHWMESYAFLKKCIGRLFNEMESTPELLGGRGRGMGTGSSISNCRVYAQLCKHSIYVSTHTQKKRLKRHVLQNEQYLWMVN